MFEYLNYILIYLGTCVKYETKFLYFSCVNSVCKLLGNVRIGQFWLVPPVINASFSRNKSAVDKTLCEVSSKICSNKKSNNINLSNKKTKVNKYLISDKTVAIHVSYINSL